MIEYDVEGIASELMLTTSELKEVLDVYFEECENLRPDCLVAMGNQNYKALRKIAHGFKGSSANLRMGKIVAIAAVLEQQAISESREEITLSLAILEQKIVKIKECIDIFYTDEAT